MIIKEHKTYSLICDNCGRCVDGFEYFQDAVDYACQMDWKRTLVSGEWENYCDICIPTYDYERWII